LLISRDNARTDNHLFQNGTVQRTAFILGSDAHLMGLQYYWVLL